MARDAEALMTDDLFEGLITGERRLSRRELAERVARAAAGFDGLGIGEGASVALLLRNDFAFFEASLAAMRLGAYAVPVNWHFKADEVGYILRDCDARVLVVHADLLPAIQEAIPAGTACLVVQTPPEICASYRIDPALGRVSPDATDWDRWIERHAPHQGAPRRPTYSMIYTSARREIPRACAVTRRARMTSARRKRCAAPCTVFARAWFARCRGRFITAHRTRSACARRATRRARS
jgi:acyl-CoA synthetase (AMP-forming)/AMP-acid ligase II